MGKLAESLASVQLVKMQSNNLLIIKELLVQNIQTMHQQRLYPLFATQLPPKIVKKYQMPDPKFLTKYELLIKQYGQAEPQSSRDEWIESEKKLFVWISILYCSQQGKHFTQLTSEQWQHLSRLFSGKNILLLQFTVKQILYNPCRVNWTKQEENLLQQQIKKGIVGLWSDISRAIFYKSGGKNYKNSKQCREHWFNYMDKKKVKGEWNKAEDLQLLTSYVQEGRKWAAIGKTLRKRRTEHNIKNRFYSLITKATKSIRFTDAPPEPEQDIVALIIKKLRASLQPKPTQPAQQSSSGESIEESPNGVLKNQEGSAQPILREPEEQAEDEVEDERLEVQFVKMEEGHPQNWASNYNNGSVRNPNYEHCQQYIVYQPPYSQHPWAPLVNSYPSACPWPNNYYPPFPTNFYQPQSPDSELI